MPTNDDEGSRPETIGLWVVVPVSVHAAAEAFAKTYAEEGAEEVLAALLSDLAALRAGKSGLRLSWVLGWLLCEGWPRVALGDGDAVAGKEGA